MKKILISNSCSFIGSNLVRYIYFNKLPYQIIGVDYLNSQYAKSNIYWNPGKAYKFYLGNVSDEKWMNKLLDLEKPDFIIDCCDLVNLVTLYKYASGYKIEDFVASNLYFSPCFGIRQPPSHFISQIIGNVLENKPIIVKNDGLGTRNWLWMDDLFNAVVSILNYDKKIFSVNLISSWEISDLELANHICNIMGKGHNLIRFVESPNQPLDMMTSSNSEVTLNELNWKQSSGFKNYLEHTVNWYTKNLWYFKL